MTNGRGATADAGGWRSFFFSAQDGLRLHARLYGSADGASLPVVCLPGLTRTAADFHELALALSIHPLRPRRVIAVDYRGRGGSAWDPDPARYDVRVENADLQDLLTVLDVERALFVGTSRGGLHVMALAAARPAVMAGAVLNDIGPVIEISGLMRIKSYVGRLQRPHDLEAAAALLRSTYGAGFTAFSEADWRRLAERSYAATEAGLEPLYDPALANSLAALDPGQPVAALWPLFDGLSHVPLMVVRGANSDILSPATLEAMAARRPDLATLVVPGQGHAPPLWEAEVIKPILDFLFAAEDRLGRSGRPL
jgi:pimeloyl-ACP methyl ester carboxylesterase